jgi:two-component system chemotaxis response regulator CheY
LDYGFVEASDGKEALSILQNEHLDIAIILLDWNMPGMNGYDFLLRVKTEPKYLSIPVMMVTTETEKESIIKAIQAGAVNYMVKPFSMEELVKKILESLGKGGV